MMVGHNGGIVKISKIIDRAETGNSLFWFRNSSKPESAFRNLKTEINLKAELLNPLD